MCIHVHEIVTDRERKREPEERERDRCTALRRGCCRAIRGWELGQGARFFQAALHRCRGRDTLRGRRDAGGGRRAHA